MMLLLTQPSLAHWLLIPGVVAAGVSAVAVDWGLRRDLYRVQPGTPAARLLQLALNGEDAGLVGRLRAAGWSWQRLDSWAVVGCIELAAAGRDGGLVRDLATMGWALDAPEAPGLVEVAGRALAAARRLDVAEVVVEVPGLLQTCHTPLEMHVACAELAGLCRRLDEVAEVEDAHHRLLEAGVVETQQQLEQVSDARTAEAARALAVASLESSTQAVGLRAAAHRAAIDEHLNGPTVGEQCWNATEQVTPR